MSFGLIIVLFVVLIAVGILGFKFLTQKEKHATSSINSLEDLLEKRKKDNNYRAPIFFFSTFVALLFISWIFDSGYNRLGERKLYQKVVEEVDTIFAYSVPPPPPPKQPEKPKPEVVEKKSEVVEIKKVEKLEKKDTTPVALNIPEAPPVPAGPAGPPGPPQTTDTKIYFPDELTSQATYPGGLEAEKKYLQAKLYKVKPPAKYRLSGKAYTVKVSVVIDKNGELKDVDLLKRYKVELDKSTQDKILNAIRSMPNWIPGKVLDEPKKSRYIIPITLSS